MRSPKNDAAPSANGASAKGEIRTRSISLAEAHDLRSQATTPSDSLLASGASTKPHRTPSDRGVSRTTTAYEPFPVVELPDPFRAFVAEAAVAIGCDPALVALPLLAASASAVGNARCVELKEGWREPCALWCCVVAESGSSKTPAMRAALDPLRTAQRHATKAHDAALKVHAEAVLRHEAALVRWKKDAAAQNDPGVPPSAPSPPVAKRLIVSDITVEALAPILLGNPRGVLVARDELAGWLGSFDAYRAGKGCDAATWLSLHNGGSILVDRKIGGSLHVPSGLVSICGGVQPGAFVRAIGDEHRENGLLARLLLAMPPRRAKEWTESEVDRMIGFELAHLFDRLLDLRGELDEHGDPRPKPLTLDGGAKGLWVAFFNENAKATARRTGEDAAACSKIEAACARLALLFRLIVDPHATTIDEAAMRSAIALARWFRAEALRIYADLAGGSEARSLAESIVRKGNDLTAAEVSRFVRRFRGDPETAEHAMIDLERRGFGRWFVQPSGERGGRPTRRFRVSTGDGGAEPPGNADDGRGSVDTTRGGVPIDGDTPPADSWADGSPIVPPAGMDAGDGWGQV